METNLDNLREEISKLVKDLENAKSIYDANMAFLNNANVTFSEKSKKDIETLVENTKKEIDLLQEKKQEYSKLLTEARDQIRKDQAQQLIDSKAYTKSSSSIDKSQVEDKEKTVEELVALQKLLVDESEKTAEATTEATAKLEKDSQKYLGQTTKKWSDVATKTKEYTNMAGSAISNMFGGITKNIDQDIANKKQEVTELTKEITQAQKDLARVQKESANEVARVKDELLSEEKIKGGDPEQLKADLAELETLYNFQTELDAENTRREEEEGYKKQELTEGQQKRYNDLMQTHASYVASLQHKTDAEKAAGEAVSQLEAEKAEKEEEIRKKEKEKKKVEAAQQLTQAGINIAQGITQAWALGPILGPIMAAIVGAAGGIQIAYMSKQMKKLEDGGLLRGKRHAQGGMRIEGSNIEVEGGEYVVNRQSTARNMSLLSYINGNRRQLNADDVHTFFASDEPRFQVPQYPRVLESGGQVPMLPVQVDISNSELLAGIQNIKIEPHVAVTDIMDVHKQMVAVDEWVGMK